MTDLKHDNSTRLLWIDLEMTGLDVKKDRIIEIAAIITDFEFKELDVYATRVKQDEVIVRRRMQKNQFWRDQLDANQDRIENFLIRMKEFTPADQAKKELEIFVKRHFKNEPAILAGNSIHCDRGFIRQWWPNVEKLLHYRMLDVSAYKIIMQNKYKIIYKKKETHRALEDIRESIAELKFYLRHFK
jgi:oligoribonuclease